MKKTILAVAALLLGGATAASATVTQVSPAFAPLTGTFVEVVPALPNPAGVYGVELRGGDSNPALNGTFEVAVGKATSNVGAGNFDQAQYNWGCQSGGAAGCGTVVPFTLTWTATALSFTLNGVTTVSSPGGADLAALTGNTIKFYAKRDATFTISDIDGTAFAISATGDPSGAGTATNELFFWSNDNWGGNGLTVTGTVRIHGGGNSANEILIKHGNYTPFAAVPEPATWSLMIVGFAMTGFARRRTTVAA